MTPLLIIVLIVIAVVGAAAWMANHNRNEACPRVYLGYNCKGHNCDHSNHAWGTLGIDKDELIYGQPYKGGWLDPNDELYRQSFYDRFKKEY